MRAAASRSRRFVYDSSFPCRIVRVAEARERSPTLQADDVPRGLLVRVLAVAQVADLLERELIDRRAVAVGIRPPCARRTDRPSTVDRRERRRRSPCRTRRCARSPSASARSGTPSVGVCVERRRADADSRRVDDHEHAAEILRRRADERRAADVDLFDQRVERRRRDSPPPSTNGYRLTTTTSTRPMPCDRARPDRRDDRGARGCRRGAPGAASSTRPSIISGNPVRSETPVTARPASVSARAVPPVDTSS